MVEAMDWGAQRRVALVPVDGVNVTIGKRGIGNLNKTIWGTPGLGELFEAVVDAAMKETDPEKRSSAVEAAIKGALKAAASVGGSSPGKVARNLAPKLIPALLDLIADDTILASEDERGPYRAWLDTLGPRGILDAVSGWVRLNLPELHGPFVDLTAKWLVKGRMALDGMSAGAKDAPTEQPQSPEPEPVGTLTAMEPVPEPAPLAA
ncbi:hypothetical protein [Methylobacterium indicum]|uniref:Uncharacterized protein n=1 Tax=Methylobacterium indicum TaxID=1775910 RepID=A0A8H9C4F5_9HYPH|nr:hypothetical protein [Methylobacterium indicum]BCM83597.1 hypothetical protein mvi_20580 [Methylobacterium indicum]